MFCQLVVALACNQRGSPIETTSDLADGDSLGNSVLNLKAGQASISSMDLWKNALKVWRSGRACDWPLHRTSWNSLGLC